MPWTWSFRANPCAVPAEATSSGSMSVTDPVSSISWVWSLRAREVAEPSVFVLVASNELAAAVEMSCLWSARAASVAVPTAAAAFVTSSGAALAKPRWVTHASRDPDPSAFGIAFAPGVAVATSSLPPCW